MVVSWFYDVAVVMFLRCAKKGRKEHCCAGGFQKYNPNVTQDEWDQETTKTVLIDIDEEEEENLRQLPRRSLRLQIDQSINVPAAGISQAALTVFMGMYGITGRT